MLTTSKPLRFTHAIVRTPCENLVDGISTANLGKPNYAKALRQHRDYVEALQCCGLDVTVLPADEQYPDSTFVEDVALLTLACAILTRPGATTRQGEVATIRDTISAFYPAIETIAPPGTVDAGDIMMVGDDYYIGRSKRTNKAGIDQIVGILQRYGMRGIPTKMNDMLHLKTGLSYLEHNKLLISRAFADEPKFASFEHLEISPDESYAANSVWINDNVLVPKGFPKTLAMIKAAAYNTIEVETSEFRKLDGGLSCLSLRF